MGDKITEEKGDNQISQNYFEMNETGKEKLNEVAALIKKIWDTVRKTEIKSRG